MKKILLALGCCVALFFEICNGCKEVPPTITFGASAAKDTTYVITPVPATDAHNVLIEEFTGESCSNCPAAHAGLDANASVIGGTTFVISYYENSSAPINIPPSGAYFDFRNDKASTILASAIFTTNADNTYPNLPGGGVDRAPVTSGTPTYLGASAWSGLIATRAAATDSLNLAVASVFSMGVATITATITYTQAVSTPQNLSIAIVEDSIIDYQEQPLGVIDSTYLFKDVFVDMVTPVPFGDAILDTLATKEAGRVLKKVYTYTVPTSFAKGIVTPARCRVIAFVHQPSGASPDFHVIQSAQAKLVAP